VENIPQWKVQAVEWLKDNGIISSDHSPIEQIDFGTLAEILRKFAEVYKLTK
jgi:hypothetical protein